MATTYLADKLAENYTTDNFIKNLLNKRIFDYCHICREKYDLPSSPF